MQKQIPLLGKDGNVSITKLKRRLLVLNNLKLKQMPDMLPRERHFIFYDLGISGGYYRFAKQSLERALGDSEKDAKKALKNKDYAEALHILLGGLEYMQRYQGIRYTDNALKFYFAAKEFLEIRDSTDAKLKEAGEKYPNEWNKLSILWHDIKVDYEVNAAFGPQPAFSELAAQAGYGNILKRAV
ncbi:hypothetical protein COU37_03555 [Candidatus Micrarchaeota archaeon CG10_big_fil_rev_8_21_14_0_10_45_29]|nr:MAG: hypothetical protein COU37_03555 [Candidatus Micrarchaeota archaeon CG10_big_fil_rev_8_21_14_0_10_45_29]